MTSLSKGWLTEVLIHACEVVVMTTVDLKYLHTRIHGIHMHIKPSQLQLITCAAVVKGMMLLCSAKLMHSQDCGVQSDAAKVGSASCDVCFRAKIFVKTLQKRRGGRTVQHHARETVNRHSVHTHTTHHASTRTRSSPASLQEPCQASLSQLAVAFYCTLRSGQ